MTTNPMEQMMQTQKAGADMMAALMQAAFNSVEQLAALNFAATREFFDVTTQNAHQLLNIKDPQDLVKMNTTMAQPNVQKMIEYSNNLYALAAKLQKDMTAILEAQYGNLTRTVASTLEQSGTAVAGGDVFASTMKSMLDTANAAYGNLTQMTRQLTEMADANLQAATSATTQAVSATAAATSEAAAGAKRKGAANA